MSRLLLNLSLVALVASVSGCATRLPPTTTSTSVATLPATVDHGALVARAALDVIGTPYVYGGNSIEGFDCSGLVQYAHARAGIDVPRTTASQYSVANPDLQRFMIGDVLFFRIKGRIAHSGIYLGDGRFVHAPATGKQVTVSRTDNPFYRRRLVGARRFR